MRSLFLNQHLPWRYSLFATWLVGVSILLLLNGCSQSSAEKALVGQWVSPSDQTVYTFRDDGTFEITEPNRQTITGRFQAIADYTSLSDAQFTLDGGYDIRFLPTGEAFYHYVDGSGGSNLFRRAR